MKGPVDFHVLRQEKAALRERSDRKELSGSQAIELHERRDPLVEELVARQKICIVGVQKLREQRPDILLRRIQLRAQKTRRLFRRERIELKHELARLRAILLHHELQIRIG